MKLHLKNKILIGITLFSMFFGAGNLIFPPFLGNMAGRSIVPAFLGFALSAVCLPVLGVIAVTKSDGLEALASKVHPLFSKVYILLLYLAIGPCLAIPRTASTSFSMAVPPFLSGGNMIWLIRSIYTILFFSAAFAVALHPEKLTEYLGKKLTPVLLILIVIVFAATVFSWDGSVAVPAADYIKQPAVKGFLDGYQTMDTLAGLNFGMIVVMNLREKGVKKEEDLVRETVSAGWIAGGILFSVYAMLTFIGVNAGSWFGAAANGTETLTEMVSALFGQAGTVLLALIFVIACFNTCVGLLSCCGKYFQGVFPRISYRKWVFIFAFVSMLIANAGLDTILKLSVPVLNAIYPLAILLIFLSCMQRLLGRYRAVYPSAVLLCGGASVITVMDMQGLQIPLLTPLVRNLPAYDAGFGWLVPTVAGIGLGILLSTVHRKRPKNGDQYRKV
ncbi:branched-chain amino acid transport system II carrier protein [Mediterraneibacter sp. ICN-202921]|uniref:branched-chain amino acid transport system II carrier protein n=1 Tax=Mediterraneibacter sp. ICN-202921 TaxID=3134657 RepID=UPI0030C2AC11